MEKKKKKLTISVSSKKTHNAPHYVQSRQKTSVVIEKKPTRKWGEKKFHQKDTNITKTKTTGNFFSKKLPTNRNYDLRKIAEERARARAQLMEIMQYSVAFLIVGGFAIGLFYYAYRLRYGL